VHAHVAGKVRRVSKGALTDRADIRPGLGVGSPHMSGEVSRVTVGLFRIKSNKIKNIYREYEMMRRRNRRAEQMTKRRREQ
jgi:hypothetical protein